MTTLTHIAEWTFHKEDRPTLSDASNLTASGGRVRLVAGRPDVYLPGLPARVYSTADDLYVRTPAFAPGSLVAWGFVELIGSTPADENGNQVTSLDVRIFDGAGSRWWDGTTWASAGAGEWNTLADLNANLPEYDGGTIAFEVRLRTTDVRLTPSLTRVKLKWSGRSFSFFEEWIYNTLVASLKASIRPATSYTIAAPGGGAIALNEFPLDAGFAITNVIAVYDHTSDPTHTNNLFDSFSSNVIALTGEIPAGNTAWIVFRYAPQIAVTTSMDYDEEAKVPAVWITGIRQRTAGTNRVGGRGPSIMNRATGSGAVFPNPIPLLDLDITYAVLSPGSLDLLALNEALLHWFETHPVLVSPALDTGVHCGRQNVIDWSTGRASAREPNYLTGTFYLRNVPLVGDPAASAADGSGTATAGAIEAGDPAHPGVGYAVSTVRLANEVLGGTGSGTLDIE